LVLACTNITLFGALPIGDGLRVVQRKRGDLIVQEIAERKFISPRLTTATGVLVLNSKAEIVIDLNLLISATDGDLSKVLDLLSKGADFNTVDNSGCAPLYMSSQNGHVPIVKTLLKSGAGVNTTNIDGNTPLFIASQNGSVDIVEALLENGAIVDAANIEKRTALILASKNGHAAKYFVTIFHI